MRRLFDSADVFGSDGMRRRHGDDRRRATQAPDLVVVVRIIVVGA
jgi:hypothetical protein